MNARPFNHSLFRLLIVFALIVPLQSAHAQMPPPQGPASSGEGLPSPATLEPGKPSQLGGGTITISVDSSVPAEYHQYILDLFNQIYQPAVDLFGPPAFSRNVVVKYKPGSVSTYGSSIITMCILPQITLPYDPGNPDDWGFDFNFIHELLHAFHDSIHVADWVEEGMAEAGTRVISLYVTANGIRYIPQNLYEGLSSYDYMNQMGANVLGDSHNQLVYYNLAPDMFFILISAEATPSSIPYARYDFFRKLNHELMSHPDASVDDLAAMIDKISDYEVDGLPAGGWFAHQAIAGQNLPPGTYLGVYWFPLIGSLEAFLVRRDSCTSDRTLSANIDYSITNLQGDVVQSGTFPVANGYGSTVFSTSGWPKGGYKIDAHGELAGVTFSAENFFVLGASPFRSEDGVALAADSSGGNLISNPLTSKDGIFRLNENAAAVLAQPITNTLPLSVTVGASGYFTRSVSIPFPFTRFLAADLHLMPDQNSVFLPMINTPKPAACGSGAR